MRTFGIALALVLGLTALAQAQSRPNPSLAWGGVYKNQSIDERFLRGNQALTEWLLRNGGNNAGGAGTVINNGPVTYTGPNSGSTVINTHNLNDIQTDITANNSVISVDNTANQTATGAQTGNANANAVTGNGATQTTTQTNN